MAENVFFALSQGALLVTANRRLARQHRLDFDELQLAAGVPAWPNPAIRAWPDWMEQSIGQMLPDLILPSTFAEKRAWRKIIEDAGDAEPLLDIRATVAAVQQAWTYCRQYQLPLNDASFEQTEESKRFQTWSGQFEARIASRRWLPLPMWEEWLTRHAEPGGRELLLDGFDELTPAQRLLLDRRGNWRPLNSDREPAGTVTRSSAESPQEEIELAARWARALLESRRAGRVGIVVQNLSRLRSAIAATFEEVLGKTLFNISLGLPLTDWPVVADGILWLRWMAAPLPADDASRLLRSPFWAAADIEMGLRSLYDVETRKANLMELSTRHARAAGPPQLAAAIGRAVLRLGGQPSRQSPGAWAGVFSGLLADGGWPGPRTQSSAERQAVARWQRVLGDFAALDIVERPMTFGDAVRLLTELASEELFQPESPEMPIQILEALQASGSRFDAMWAMGMTDTAWPALARPNPFLPRSLQRSRNLPHATPERELQFARDVTSRLMHSASVVHFSYARRDGEEEQRPSQLISGCSETNLEIASYTTAIRAQSCKLEGETINDTSAPAILSGERVRGGTAILANQSRCPFRSFAIARLNAEEWCEPEPGLTPKERGTAVHAALAVFWQRVRTRNAAGIEDALDEAIAAGMAEIERAGRERLVALEERRMRAVLEAWIELDFGRPDNFAVLHVEHELDLAPAGLPLRGRADRIDRLDKGGLVLIDYKTTAPSAAAWEGDRPADLQLPAYALSLSEPPRAIAFAQLKRGESRFNGLAEVEGLLPKVGQPEQPWQDQLDQWRRTIQRIWNNFQLGDAAIDPKDGGAPCLRCHLHSLCRIDAHLETETPDAG